MTKIMDKETWIKSRTNTPNKLGRGVWGNFYELMARGRQLPKEAKEALKPLYMDMAREYLEKLGISWPINDSNLEYILGYMKNMDVDQNQEAMALGLEAGLGMLEKKNPPKKAPTPRPNPGRNQDSLMDKESWIKSRTSDPDRLGKDTWGAMYDLIRAGERLPEEKGIKALQKEMMKEYLSKNGLTYSNPKDPNLDHVFVHFSQMDPNLPTWAAQVYLDYVSGNLKTPSPKNKRSPLDTLREGSKRFFEDQKNPKSR